MNTFEAIHGGENHRLWIGGHRGHASATRENTTANFAEVLGMGVDYIEIDVQLTRDRQAVIFHDMALEERTPLHGHIRDYTVAELKAAFEIDTLEEALAWCKAHGMAVLLEVKSCELLMHEDMPTLAQRIVEALQKADFFDQCVVFGVNHWILREVCRLDSRCKIALIVPHVPDDPVALMRHMGAIIYLCFIDNLSRPADRSAACGGLSGGWQRDQQQRADENRAGNRLRHGGERHAGSGDCVVSRTDGGDGAPCLMFWIFTPIRQPAGHAYNTIYEMAQSASRKGLALLGISDHGPAMEGSASKHYFRSSRCIPRELYGVKILFGCELNIMDYDGGVDLDEVFAGALDYGIASLHDVCITPAAARKTPALISRRWKTRRCISSAIRTTARMRSILTSWSATPGSAA